MKESDHCKVWYLTKKQQNLNLSFSVTVLTDMLRTDLVGRGLKAEVGAHCLFHLHSMDIGVG